MEGRGGSGGSYSQYGTTFVLPANWKLRPVVAQAKLPIDKRTSTDDTSATMNSIVRACCCASSPSGFVGLSVGPPSTLEHTVPYPLPVGSAVSTSSVLVLYAYAAWPRTPTHSRCKPLGASSRSRNDSRSRGTSTGVSVPELTNVNANSTSL